MSLMLSSFYKLNDLLRNKSIPTNIKFENIMKIYNSSVYYTIFFKHLINFLKEESFDNFVELMQLQASVIMDRFIRLEEINKARDFFSDFEWNFYLLLNKKNDNLSDDLNTLINDIRNDSLDVNSINVLEIEDQFFKLPLFQIIERFHSPKTLKLVLLKHPDLISHISFNNLSEEEFKIYFSGISPEYPSRNAWIYILNPEILKISDNWRIINEKMILLPENLACEYKDQYFINNIYPIVRSEIYGVNYKVNFSPISELAQAINNGVNINLDAFEDKYDFKNILLERIINISLKKLRNIEVFSRFIIYNLDLFSDEQSLQLISRNYFIVNSILKQNVELDIQVKDKILNLRSTDQYNDTIIFHQKNSNLSFLCEYCSDVPLNDPRFLLGYGYSLFEDDLGSFKDLYFSHENCEYLLFGDLIHLKDLAACFGSIRIYNYLNLNGAKQTNNILEWAICGENSGIIKQVINERIDEYDNILNISIYYTNFSIFKYVVTNRNIELFLFNIFTINTECLMSIDYPIFEIAPPEITYMRNYLEYTVKYFIDSKLTEEIMQHNNTQRRSLTIDMCQKYDNKLKMLSNDYGYKTFDDIINQLLSLNLMHVNSVSDLTEKVKEASFFGIPLYKCKNTDNKRRKQIYSCSFEKYCDCKSYIIYLIVDNIVYFRDASFVHNHTLDPHVIKIRNTLPLNTIQKIEEFTVNNTDARSIRRQLSIPCSKDVLYNYRRSLIKYKKMRDLSNSIDFIMAKKGYHIYDWVDENEELQLLVIINKRAFKYMLTQTIIEIDDTANTCHLPLYLFAIVGKDINNKQQVLAVAFSRRKTKLHIEKILSTYKEFSAIDPRVVVTDQYEAQIQAIKSVFPSANIIFCWKHLSATLKSHYKSAVNFLFWQSTKDPKNEEYLINEMYRESEGKNNLMNYTNSILNKRGNWMPSIVTRFSTTTTTSSVEGFFGSLKIGQKSSTRTLLEVIQDMTIIFESEYMNTNTEKQVYINEILISRKDQSKLGNQCLILLETEFNKIKDIKKDKGDDTPYTCDENCVTTDRDYIPCVHEIFNRIRNYNGEALFSLDDINRIWYKQSIDLQQTDIIIDTIEEQNNSFEPNELQDYFRPIFNSAKQSKVIQQIVKEMKDKCENAKKIVTEDKILGKISVIPTSGIKKQRISTNSIIHLTQGKNKRN